MDEKDKNFGLRLKRLRKIKDLNQTELAEKIGLGVSTIRDHESGNYPNKNTLRKYIDFYQCSRSWLLTGYGEPYGVPLERLPDYSGEDPLMSNFDFVKYAKARLGAGGGLVVESEEFVDYYAFRREWLRRIGTSKENMVLMRVEGDSMEETVFDNDMVMVDLGRREIQSGKIFALGVGETVMLKRLEYTPANTIKVKSDNQAYEPYELKPDEIRVIGQVIWIARQLVRFDM